MKNIFLIIIILLSFKCIAQKDTLYNREPQFYYTEHPSYIFSSFLEMVELENNHLISLMSKSRNLCLYDWHFFEFTLTRDSKIIDIKFSKNYPESLKESTKEALQKSEKYWKPKKVKGKYVNAKIVYARLFLRLKGCQEDEEQKKDFANSFNNSLEQMKDKSLKQIFPQYKKFDLILPSISYLPNP